MKFPKTPKARSDCQNSDNFPLDWIFSEEYFLSVIFIRRTKLKNDPMFAKIKRELYLG